jgi:hypothetical protein
VWGGYKLYDLLRPNFMIHEAQGKTLPYLGHLWWVLSITWAFLPIFFKNGEALAASCRWSGWVWEIIGWSWRLQGNCGSLERNIQKNIPGISKGRCQHITGWTWKDWDFDRLSPTLKKTKETEGRFTPRGRANLLCKRLEILTCDWPKGSHRFQLLYT